MKTNSYKFEDGVIKAIEGVQRRELDERANP